MMIIYLHGFFQKLHKTRYTITSMNSKGLKVCLVIKSNWKNLENNWKVVVP